MTAVRRELKDLGPFVVFAMAAVATADLLDGWVRAAILGVIVAIAYDYGREPLREKVRLLEGGDAQ